MPTAPAKAPAANPPQVKQPPPVQQPKTDTPPPVPKPPEAAQPGTPPQQPPAAPGAPPPPGVPPPTLPPKKIFHTGDFVFDPIGYGRDIIFQVHRVIGEDLLFVVGGAFERPTPVLTRDMTLLQTALQQEPERIPQALASIAASRSLIRTANDEGILRLQILQEGLERLAPAVLAAGLGVGTLVTYNALKSVVQKLIQDRTSARVESRDYEPEQSQYFEYL